MVGCLPALKADETRIVFNLQMPPESLFKAVDDEVAPQSSATTETPTLDDAIARMAKFGSLAPDQAAKKLHKPSISAQTVPSLAGILALNAGYSTYSHKEGRVMFPWRYQAEEVDLWIASKFNVVKESQATASHLTAGDDSSASKTPPIMAVPDGTTVERYSFKRQKDDKGTLFWRVAKEEIPADRKLKSISLALVTKPSNIVVRKGDYMTPPCTSLRMPPAIFMVGANDGGQVLLNNADILPFFEPLNETLKMDDTTATTTTLMMND